MFVFKKIPKVAELPMGFFFVVFMAFIYAPLFLLYGDDKAGEQFSILVLIPLISFCLGILLLSLLLYKFSPKISRVLDTFMVGVALYLLVTVIFFPVSPGILNGKELLISWQDKISHLLLFVACLALSIICLFKPAINHLCRKAMLALGGFAIVMSAYMGLTTLPLAENVSWRKVTGLSSQHNIIVICLDMVQQEFAKQYFAETPHAQTIFDGFVFFTNTASASPATQLSYSTTLRGGMFSGNAWEMDPANNLVNDLGKYDYNVAASPVVVVPTKGSRANVSTLPRSANANMLDGAVTLIFSGFNRYLPFVMPALARKEFGWESKLEHRNGFKMLIESVHIDDSIERRLLWFHTLQTHCPVRLDKSGAYSADLTEDDVHGEIADAFTLVGNFLEKLKMLGIYDSSLIFILSDHGSATLRQMKNLKEDQLYLLSYADQSKKAFSVGSYQPLIMVKRPQAKGLLQNSDRAAVLMDLRKTINEFVAPGSGAEFYGYNLLAPESMPREREVPFFEFQKDSLEKSDYMNSDNWRISNLHLPLDENYPYNAQRP